MGGRFGFGAWLMTDESVAKLRTDINKEAHGPAGEDPRTGWHRVAGRYAGADDCGFLLGVNVAAAGKGRQEWRPDSPEAFHRPTGTYQTLPRPARCRGLLQEPPCVSPAGRSLYSKK